IFDAKLIVFRALSYKSCSSGADNCSFFAMTKNSQYKGKLTAANLNSRTASVYCSSQQVIKFN
ncbi:hypothetical protein, partial [uncultured Corynebacterium sp.]|uniref:hypothetical protein n=1 Tax=uncultured Corynebacterium sp. TaxID=159447 RepID=UPI00259780A3